MKNFKKHIIIALSIFLIAFSFMISSLRVLPLESFHALSGDNLSLFYVTPKLVRVNGDKLYVYDSADRTIKVLSSETNDFIETDNHYRVSADAPADDILFFEDIMLIYSKANNSIIARTIAGFQEVEFDTSSLSMLAESKSIQVVKVGEESYLLTCPTNLKDGNFEIAKMTKEENKITLESSNTFKIVDSGVSTLTTYGVSYATESKEDGHIIIFLASSTPTSHETSSIMSISIDPKNVISTVSTTTTVEGANIDDEQILSMDEVTYFGEPKFAITTDKSIRFYTLSATSSSVTLSESTESKIDLDADFIKTDISGQGNILGIVSTDLKALKYYIFASDPVVEKNKFNDQIDAHTVGVGQFDYLSVSQSQAAAGEDESVKVLKSPYSNPEEPDDVVISLEDGTNVVSIGYGEYRETKERVIGWVYCMVSVDTSNYYGYINELYTSELELPSEKDPSVKDIGSYITVYNDTIIYSKPSANLDDFNTIVKRVDNSSSVRLKVLDTIYDYGYKNGNRVVKFYKVSINESNDAIGYIDRDLVINTSAITDRVIPDATVMRDNSEIFTQKDDKSEVIMTLNKNARVKVIGKRDTVTNLTHVRFNDAHGNEVEGYIYTYNLEADSWNMVQMVGILLIVINVILLIVIICIKNKVTR